MAGVAPLLGHGRPLAGRLLPALRRVPARAVFFIQVPTPPHDLIRLAWGQGAKLVGVVFGRRGGGGR